MRIGHVASYYKLLKSLAGLGLTRHRKSLRIKPELGTLFAWMPLNQVRVEIGMNWYDYELSTYGLLDKVSHDYGVDLIIYSSDGWTMTAQADRDGKIWGMFLKIGKRPPTEIDHPWVDCFITDILLNVIENSSPKLGDDVWQIPSQEEE